MGSAWFLQLLRNLSYLLNKTLFQGGAYIGLLVELFFGYHAAKLGGFWKAPMNYWKSDISIWYFVPIHYGFSASAGSCTTIKAKSSKSSRP
ncbi:membrane protein [methanotrophic bacterial endosymbiont of Bathymodiolus sp.]|nr:membrane protein [methanotrophic bacterial endosymbiont of Bathymodiolus sp.]